MSPSAALFLWSVLLLGLLCFDPARKRGTSMTLWVPLIWLFILGSRLPSVWLRAQMAGVEAQALEEGNPLDRTIFFVLILLAIGILVSRHFRWGQFFSNNLALTAFVFFGLVSVCWSDYAFIAFKRWFRDLGNYLVILVLLSDPLPLDAFRTVFRRLGYVLISLSVLLARYFPGIGDNYDVWTGQPYYVGAATSKNTLGVLCLVGGLFFFWDTVTRWSARKEKRTKQIILVNIAFLAMTFWLLHICDSATSRVCLLLGCLVIAAAHSKAFRRRSTLLKAAVPAGFLAYVTLAYGLGLNGQFAGAVGRNPTLTDRTQIWQILFDIHTNPILGTGYQSFWLGPRLERVWQMYGGPINEAHNGYLDVYLNLGLLGLFLLVGFLISGYRTICRRLDPLSSLGSLCLGLWAVLLFYNVTEAAFQGGLIWMALLPGAIAVAERSREKAPDFGITAFDNVEAKDRLLDPV